MCLFCCSADIILILLAILFPPLPVWIKRGICSADSLINIALCMLGFIPGLLVRIVVVFLLTALVLTTTTTTSIHGTSLLATQKSRSLTLPISSRRTLAVGRSLPPDSPPFTVANSLSTLLSHSRTRTFSVITRPPMLPKRQPLPQPHSRPGSTHQLSPSLSRLMMLLPAQVTMKPCRLHMRRLTARVKKTTKSSEMIIRPRSAPCQSWG
jgi:uncharacterized membrane protein YqaE (UPF0057 family)